MDQIPQINQIGYAAYHTQFRLGFKDFQAFRFEKCSLLMIEQYNLVTLFLEILESRWKTSLDETVYGGDLIDFTFLHLPNLISIYINLHTALF